MAGLKLWMANWPQITLAEVCLISAAVVFFYIMPAVVALNDARRQRRAMRREAAAGLQWPEPVATAAATVPSVDTIAELQGEEMPPETPATEPPVTMPVEPDVGLAAVPEATTSVEPPPAPVQPYPEREEAPALRVSPEASVATSELNATMPLEIQPLEGLARHRFRLDELRQARLADWPPAAVRNDVNRSRVWNAAERLMEDHWATLGAVRIGSPYPARSTCLGAAEATGTRYRLHFLLFPVLWPIGEDQAVAQAVFEVDPVRGEFRGWVDALRPTELTPDHRREIQASGGGA